MKLLTILQVVALIIVNYVGVSDCKLGAACTSNRTCTGYDFSMYESEYCREGICTCSPQIDVMYIKYSLEPFCESSQFMLSFLFECNPDSCHENAECVALQVPVPFYKTHDNYCRCKEGYIKISNKCYEASHQKVLQPCSFKSPGPILTCDINENSYCKNGRCICFDSFFANISSGKCEPKSSYIRIHNLTSYRVRPGEYCTKKEHCIEGLECNNFKCSCPSACPYKEEEQICDCGPVPKVERYLVGPILVGIILGVLIIGFWIRMIRKTIERHGKKRDHFDALPTDNNQDTPARNTYSLNPVNSQPVPNDISASPSGASPPLSGYDGKQSSLAPPVESDDISPRKIGGDQSQFPTVPPQPSDYFIESPRYSYPRGRSPPPPYTDQPSETSFLPYSIHPSATNAPPYSVNPPPLSYPYSYSAPVPESYSPPVPLPESSSPSAPLPESSHPSVPLPESSIPSAPLPESSCPAPLLNPGPSDSLPYASSLSAAVPSPTSSSTPLPYPSSLAVSYPLNPSDMSSGGNSSAPYGFSLHAAPVTASNPAADTSTGPPPYSP